MCVYIKSQQSLCVMYTPYSIIYIVYCIHIYSIDYTKRLL